MAEKSASSFSVLAIFSTVPLRIIISVQAISLSNIYETYSTQSLSCENITHVDSLYFRSEMLLILLCLIGVAAYYFGINRLLGRYSTRSYLIESFPGLPPGPPPLPLIGNMLSFQWDIDKVRVRANIKTITYLIEGLPRMESSLWSYIHSLATLSHDHHRGSQSEFIL